MICTESYFGVQHMHIAVSHATYPTQSSFFLFRHIYTYMYKYMYISFMFALKLLPLHFFSSRIFYCPSVYRRLSKTLYLLVSLLHFTSRHTARAGSAQDAQCSPATLLWVWLNVPEIIERILYFSWKTKEKSELNSAPTPTQVVWIHTKIKPSFISQ